MGELHIIGVSIFFYYGGIGLFPFNWGFGWGETPDIFVICVGPIRLWKGFTRGR